MELTTIVIGAWNAFSTKVMGFIPNLIGAIIIFIAGWLLARLLKLGAVKLLKLIKFDTAGEKTGLIEFLQKGNITKTPTEIVGTLIYWFIMILVLIASLDALGLPIVSDMLNEVFLYIPNVVAAVIVLILGMLFGNLLSAIVRTTASNAGIAAADGLGKAALYAIVLFSASIALVQLGIGEDIVESAFIIAFGATALALAIAFGLGGKDLATDLLKKWLEEKGRKD